MRLLIIEDEPRLLRSLAKATREAGYAVDIADSGDDGLFKALSNEYDCVILDILLPGIDGWEVLTRLRKTQATPVLMLTAMDSTCDRVRGLDSGADDYLVKPFELDELLARIRAIIRRHAGRSRTLIEIGALSIDPRARQVSYSGKAVGLTPREYAILEYLAMHQGKIISRATLYEHLFDEGDDTLSNLLDVHIHGIRRKLSADLIVTRRGEGYYIE